MLDDIGGGAGAGAEDRKFNFSDHTTVPHRPIGNHSRCSSHFQTSCKNGTAGRRRSVPTTVLHQNVSWRTSLNALALRIFGIEKYVQHVDVFSGRNVPQCERGTD